MCTLDGQREDVQPNKYCCAGQPGVWTLLKIVESAHKMDYWTTVERGKVRESRER